MNWGEGNCEAEELLPLPQWCEAQLGFIVELCCPFYVCSKCMFEIIPVWCVFFSWLKSISKAYCESLFSLNYMCFFLSIYSFNQVISQLSLKPGYSYYFVF